MGSGYSVPLQGIEYNAQGSNLDNLSSLVIEDAFYIKMGRTVILAITYTADPIANGLTTSAFDLTIPWPVDPDVNPFTVASMIWGGGSASPNGDKLRVTFTGNGTDLEKRFIGIAYRSAS